MLIQFSVENFSSFKGQNTLNMVAGSGKEHPQFVFSFRPRGATKARPISLIKSAAIYGPNASGKSNLIKALVFMKKMVRDSSKDTQAGEPIAMTPYRLQAETADQPATLEIIFVRDDVRYRYGFSCDQTHVHEEWLFFAPKGREAKLFVRTGGKIETGDAFDAPGELADMTRDNALFLSVAAQFNVSSAEQVLGWFADVQLKTDDDSFPHQSMRLFQNSRDKERLLRLLKMADHGISDIALETVDFDQYGLPPEIKKLIVNDLKTRGKDKEKLKFQKMVSFHPLFDAKGNIVDTVAFDFERESRGTKKLFEMAGMIFSALDKGAPMVMDELECSLHPMLTRLVIDTFHSEKTNPRHAQLVFTTHDTGLLHPGLFRRDQFWLIQKDEYGASELYSIADFRVRSDKSHDKAYLQGRYGAVPLLHDPVDIFGDSSLSKARDNALSTDNSTLEQE